ncbi:GntR family transcriptional regulator, arabinose operon transcriptional repressor [Marinitoga hydrogenitolerans DSM 16785]|uniref:GntR family transcriptional regulator, arabinose operon transcriptional repressor n=1 Tax=Marinitoga hydrogenitolerans (strain DSM 16785 / JCM 12826 / AT1271) TaxID=1122195 RepID=A0A1M4ZML1_MARH1|nr:GntR family transcriptional regulator [Marinitoga hydrogenitolerans]SHF19165.1 GntR family transcriptional regulator, arabinose operon transcriptional repressor [Marinitoga hydrogenitolerans DSM 16785]
MNMDDLDRNGNQPLYRQIRDFIYNNIQNGIFKPGEAIPTERELCDKLKVSRYTVRRAIQELVHEGYLYRVQGNGTFVFDKEEIHEKGDNKLIGVILTHCEHEMEANILSGIEKAIQSEGYTMTFMSSNNDYKKEAEAIQRMKRNGVSGLIIMPAEDQKDSTAISDLKNEQFPFVLVDRRLQDCETDCVMSDNINGGYKATEYLIKLGHEKIAFVKAEFSETSSIEDRIIGYKKALKEYGLDYRPELLFSYDERKLNTEEIYEELYKFIKEKKPTAIVAVNDYVALVIIKMCRVKGISIPNDISLVGFDNLEFIKHLEVPLTTIAQFSKEIGFSAAKLLINKIKVKYNNTIDKINKELLHQIYYPVELVIRDSCSNV